MPGSQVRAIGTDRINEIYDQKRSSPIGELVATTALSRSARVGHLYEFSKAPISPHPKLSGNKIPEQTALQWLKNKNKCNQFIGDVFSEAGLPFPTYSMTDGSKHYVNAERLPKESKYFERITSKEVITFGDLIVFDHLNQGENGAHVDVVTGVGIDGKLLLTGALKTGAVERVGSNLFNGYKIDIHNRRWVSSSGSIYILRPRYY